jgi:hypothetical protein
MNHHKTSDGFRFTLIAVCGKGQRVFRSYADAAFMHDCITPRAAQQAGMRANRLASQTNFRAAPKR